VGLRWVVTPNRLGGEPDEPEADRPERGLA
jgi:hypothetical protein